MPVVQDDYERKPGLPIERDGKTYYRLHFTNGDARVFDKSRKAIGRVRDGARMTDDELLDRVLG